MPTLQLQHLLPCSQPLTENTSGELLPADLRHRLNRISKGNLETRF